MNKIYFKINTLKNFPFMGNLKKKPQLVMRLNDGEQFLTNNNLMKINNF